MISNVFTIAAGSPFAESLARGVVEMCEAEKNPLALADVTIYLPTRRSVRTLGETFARVQGGAALLPQLKPLGDLDDEALLFDPTLENLNLAPTISPIRRRLLLAALVERWDRARRDGAAQLTFSQAASFAAALARFLDEAETHGADLSRLEDLAPHALAEHWAEVKDFLVLLRDEWPRLVEAEGAIEPARRRNVLLSALARTYATAPPQELVLAAGTTGSVPATAELIAAIARMPNGLVVLPGLDRDIDDESWNALDPGHPQFGLKDLLGRIGIDRRAVRDWRTKHETRPARIALLRETLRPAPTTDAWRGIADRGNETIAQGLEGISLVEAANPGEEALVIALVLREELETPGRTAALVTPDRNLARRVAAELCRWNIAIDDSAGKPLAHTATGAFLLLLLEVVDRDFAPVPLLAMLKHPLAACGRNPGDFRRLARILDQSCLRGPSPDPGIAGIRNAVANSGDADARNLLPWIDEIARGLAPLCAAFDSHEVDIADIVDAHVKSAEELARSDVQSGAMRLWQGEAGAAAAELFAALAVEARGLPSIKPDSYLPLIRILIDERAVRPPYGRHPRLSILGPLEARLQSFDTVVLGGLNEGSWPSHVAADPWLSRPMRTKLGLPSPERAIGLAAHDFATLAAGPRVVLTRALKANGTPTVASRWLQRLVQLTSGLDLKIDVAKPYLAFAALLEQPLNYSPERRPEPRPPVKKRPRGLSVTEIETWLRDPYAIYAKHVLDLRPLDPLDAALGPLERGTAIHRILELFLKNESVSESDAEERLVAIADRVFREMGISHAKRAIWFPRFRNAAHWFMERERGRKSGIVRSHLEIRGTRTFQAPAGPFTLRGRADRIDVLRAGGGTIIDYKTGRPPTSRQVDLLLAPQLPLEGAILAIGGFEEVGRLVPKEFEYIHIGGGAEPGKVVAIVRAEELADEAAQKLSELIAAFDVETTPYLPRVIAYREDTAGDYDHLARVREWSVAGQDEE